MHLALLEVVILWALVNLSVIGFFTVLFFVERRPRHARRRSRGRGPVITISGH